MALGMGSTKLGTAKVRQTNSQIARMATKVNNGANGLSRFICAAPLRRQRAAEHDTADAVREIMEHRMGHGAERARPSQWHVQHLAEAARARCHHRDTIRQ